MKPDLYSLSEDSGWDVSAARPNKDLEQQLPIILLVDDDPDDIDFFLEALDRVTCQVRLASAANGKEALQFLYLHRPLPCLIVMDLNMPVMDGKEAIREILKDRRFQGIPIVVLTTSHSEQDQKFCDERRLAFFSKPASSEDLTTIVRELVSVCLER